MSKTQRRRIQRLIPGRRQPRRLGPVSRIGRLRVASAIANYLADIRARRSAQAAEQLRRLLTDFARPCRRKRLRSINRRDLIGYMTNLRQRGLADRTIFNRTSTVLTFLRSYGFDGLLSRRDLPRYTQKAVDAYSEAEIAQLLRAGDENLSLILEFFLATGCREQEVANVTWNDVDFKQKLIRVTAKPQWNWKPKDCEERLVPIPEWLVNKLAALRLRSDGPLLFPNRLGRPEGHFLAKLKTLTLHSGLNCGHCVNKRAQSCRDKAVCSRWSLHKFRRTFATMHHESGVSARTLQAWLGHSNLETTLRYLRVSDLCCNRVRSHVDGTFTDCVPQNGPRLNVDASANLDGGDLS
jgi:integrase/recombinase XerD